MNAHNKKVFSEVECLQEKLIHIILMAAKRCVLLGWLYPFTLEVMHQIKHYLHIDRLETQKTLKSKVFLNDGNPLFVSFSMMKK